MERKDPLTTGELSGIDPKKEAEWARRRNLHAGSSQESAKKFLILVVDDSADNVAMLSLDLQHQGYRVVTANNGEEAISVALHTLPNLILMDISMPRLDGRSEEHTSELQSPMYLVCRLLLEKKKRDKTTETNSH